jgi:perosamine synthetase
MMEEPKDSKSNYWLQTLILNINKKNLRDKILKKCHEKKIRSRPAWELLHTLKHLKKFPKMNLNNSLNIHRGIINLPSSCYKIK